MSKLSNLIDFYFFLGGDIPLDGLRMSLPDKQRGKRFHFHLQVNDFQKLLFVYHFIKEFERKFYMTTTAV